MCHNYVGCFQINITGLPVIPLGDVDENDERVEIKEINPLTFFASFKIVESEPRLESKYLNI